MSLESEGQDRKFMLIRMSSHGLSILSVGRVALRGINIYRREGLMHHDQIYHAMQH